LHIHLDTLHATFTGTRRFTLRLAAADRRTLLRYLARHHFASARVTFSVSQGTSGTLNIRLRG
jgi:hypothetical protein